jgi:hypothetical protein
MNQDVKAAIVGLNETKTLFRVEPLNCSGCHLTFSKMRENARCLHDLRATSSDFNDVLGNRAGISAVNKAESIFEVTSCRDTSVALQGRAHICPAITEKDGKLPAAESPLASKCEPLQVFDNAFAVLLWWRMRHPHYPTATVCRSQPFIR